MEGVQRWIDRRAVVTWCLLAISCAVMACAGDDAPNRNEAIRDVERAVHKIQRSFAAGDIDGLCARMSVRARRQAGRIAHGNARGCGRDVRAFLALIEEGGGWKHPPPRVGGVAVAADGRSAWATLSQGRGRAEVPLVDEGGAWKLDSFFGAPLDSGPELSATVVRRGRVQGNGGPVRATHAPPGWRPAPCPTVFTETFPEVSGTCELAVESSTIDVTVLTALGDFAFGTCTMRYQVAMDGQGRTWVHRVGVNAPPGVPNNGCSDIRACEDQRGRKVPWKGRIEQGPGNTLIHRFDACLDTCVGLFEGVVTTQITRDRGRVNVSASDASVGNSGFRLDGESTVAANAVTLTP